MGISVQSCREIGGIDEGMGVWSRIKCSGISSQRDREFGTLELNLRGRLGLEIESLGFISQSYREVK